MLEIRGHARGGQGMVTAFEILARVFNRLDDYQVQAFPAFGVERTGAPIQAFLRVAKTAIFNRSNIYHPHLIVVFDESLIEQVPVFDGLKEGGTVLLNTERPPQHYTGLGCKVYTVPATRISLDLGLGSKSLPIVNAAMIGAVVRIFEADLETAGQIIREQVPAKADANRKAAEIAYHKVQGLESRNDYLIHRLQAVLPEEVSESERSFYSGTEEEPEGLEAPFWQDPMSVNKTGNWRLVTPAYVNRTPPCSANCPAGTDVRRFVKLASERKFDEAYEIIYRHNPFPAVCGRVCPHFCEQQCNRNAYDEGVNIGAVERFLGDRKRNEEAEAWPVKYPEKIAVIGSGPAGLTAALRLREKGYRVTVFEAFPFAGGMMRTGIPKFRLPDEVLDEEITRIERQGVEIVLNKKVRVEELEASFDAAIVATGAHISVPLDLKNEQLAIQGISFLRNFKLYGNTTGIQKGDQVAVVGGGNTAVDVARTLLRLGAIPTIYYRRTIAEMPAIPQEVEEAIAEGVRLEFLTAPVGIAKYGNRKIALTLISMEMGEKDHSGRRRPLPLKGSEKTFLVDRLITATGQLPDDYAFRKLDVDPTQGFTGYIGKLPVFSAGDLAWGGTVAEAIGSGNMVAEEVYAALQHLPYSHDRNLPEVVLPEDINYAYFLPAARQNNQAYYPKDMLHNFTEVVKELSEEQIIEETARCLHCGECYHCGNCFNYCPDAAVYVDDNGRLRIDYDYCKGCGICVTECPCSAMRFELAASPREAEPAGNKKYSYHGKNDAD